MDENPKHRVNRDMYEDSVGWPEPLPYLCECVDEHCFASVWLTSSEFERRSAVAAVVVHGHTPTVVIAEPALAA